MLLKLYTCTCTNEEQIRGTYPIPHVRRGGEGGEEEKEGVRGVGEREREREYE